MTAARDFPRTAAIAKHVLPSLSSVFCSVRAQRASSLVETAGAILQGKGAGSGWDMRAEVRSHRRFLFAGATVFDVGANLGEWSFTVSRYLDGRAKIFMFEPQPACRLRLEPMIEMGAVLTQAAVGETDGEAILFTPDPNGTGGNASLHRRRDTYFSQGKFATMKVNVVTIDRFMEMQCLTKIDFLKMDIEGNELAALRGAKKAMQQKAIRALSFEFGSANINSRTYFHDFWDLLTGYGYKIYRVLPSGKLLQIEHYQEDLEYFQGATNYVAESVIE